jgi:hypothetical protein
MPLNDARPSAGGESPINIAPHGRAPRTGPTTLVKLKRVLAGFNRLAQDLEPGRITRRFVFENVCLFACWSTEMAVVYGLALVANSLAQPAIYDGLRYLFLASAWMAGAHWITWMTVTTASHLLAAVIMLFGDDDDTGAKRSAP